ncbi:MAG: hypothetical protein ACM3QY_09335 [Candidatus Levyibacteriota bacterium]
MPLALVAPGLLFAPADLLGRDPTCARLAGRAGAPRIQPEGIARAILDALQWPEGTAIAPLAALGAGDDPGEGFVAAADPVHLEAGATDVVLTERIDDLDRDEADALVATLAAHFAVDGLRFRAPRADAWFIHAERTPDVATTPIDAVVGRSLIAHLPRGPHAQAWKRWQDEAAMLLHEHPVNVAREARGRPTVNGVWFWGGGRLARHGSRAPVRVAAAAGHEGDLARGIALATGDSATPWPPAPGWLDEVLRRRDPPDRDRGGDPATVVVTDVIGNAGADGGVGAFVRDWLAPALAALDQRRLDALHLLADGNGLAATWTATPSGRLARLRARWGARPFLIPAAPAADEDHAPDRP